MSAQHRGDRHEQDGAPGTEENAGSRVVVYTRPGCPFCTSLRAGLRRDGLEFSEVDIWQDPDAAATVRSLADGNETVPTVVIGEWSAVNPSTGAVLGAAAEHAPADLPADRPGLVDGTLKAMGLRKPGEGNTN